jgi:hypothetical protein
MPKEYSTTPHQMTNHPVKCQHCGSKAAMAIICQGEHTDVIEDEEIGTEDWHTRWELLLCTNCNNISLLQHSDSSINEEMTGFDNKGNEVWDRELTTSVLYPVDLNPKSQIEYLDWKSVKLSWKRMLERSTTDPEGAITSARTTLESVCKQILDKKGIPYENDGDLGKLYKNTSNALNLRNNDDDNNSLKQILSGCANITSGLARLRNKYGDSHGKGDNYSKPSKKIVRLAINSAMLLSEFLVESFEESKNQDSNHQPF